MNSPIDPSEAAADIKITSTVPDPEKLEDKEESVFVKVHLDGLISFYKLRCRWSTFILICIGVLIVFQIALTFLVGMKMLDFSDYQWFLPLVVTENFVQVIGLALIVVRFLFNKEKSPSAD